ERARGGGASAGRALAGGGSVWRGCLRSVTCVCPFTALPLLSSVVAPVPAYAASLILIAARSRAEAARGLAAASAAEGRSAPLVSSRNCGPAAPSVTGRTPGAGATARAPT